MLDSDSIVLLDRLEVALKQVTEILSQIKDGDYKELVVDIIKYSKEAISKIRDNNVPCPDNVKEGLEEALSTIEEVYNKKIGEQKKLLN
ncbi:MAG TPA: hypothetical protein VII94_00845 [Candidatus Saccharimonadales bacterium]